MSNVVILCRTWIRIEDNVFTDCNENLIIYGRAEAGVKSYAYKRGIPFRSISDYTPPQGGIGAGNQSASSIACKKTLYEVAYGAKPFKIDAASDIKMAFTSSKPEIAAVNRDTGEVTVKNTGVAVITIEAGQASEKVTIKVSPKKQSVGSAKAAKGRKLTVKWAKDKMASGYQVQIGTDKKFKKNVKSKNVSKASYTFKKLKAGRKYYARVRSYKKSGNETLYGAWSKVKQSGKVKK